VRIPPALVAWPIGLLAIALLVVDDAIETRAAGRCFADPAALPVCDTALVLGASDRTASGAANLHYENRLDAAAALWHRGAVRWLLVSGDNGRTGYDEPTRMKADLVARGVPAAAIYRDFAGFRTLDSVLRARAVFGLQRFVIVSQPDHIRRAVYLARSHGIDAVGFAAAAVEGRPGLRTRIREQFARINAVLDVEILARGPRFLGEPVPVGVVAAN
jgi:SanA protein